MYYQTTGGYLLQSIFSYGYTTSSKKLLEKIFVDF